MNEEQCVLQTVRRSACARPSVWHSAASGAKPRAENASASYDQIWKLSFVCGLSELYKKKVPLYLIS